MAVALPAGTTTYALAGQLVCDRVGQLIVAGRE